MFLSGTEVYKNRVDKILIDPETNFTYSIQSRMPYSEEVEVSIQLNVLFLKFLFCFSVTPETNFSKKEQKKTCKRILR